MITNNQQIIQQTFKPSDVPFVTQRIEEETIKETIIRIKHIPGIEQKDYVLTNKTLYIFEGQQGSKFVSCRRVKLRDVFEFHLYKKNNFNNIAVIVRPGHVVFVLKFTNYLEALVFLRYLYRQQVKEDPNEDPNQFRAFDVDNQIKYGDAIGG